MSTLKAKTTLSDAKKILEQYFSHIEDLEQITAGELSQAFFFSANGKNLVGRFNTSLTGFQKDDYAYRNFSSDLIPIPKTEKIETIEINGQQLYLSITNRAPGCVFHDLSDEQITSVTPKLFDVFDAIHAVSIPETGKYGSFDQQGQALFPSFAEYLLTSFAIPYKSWHDMFLTTFAEEDFFQETYATMKGLLRHCPSERHLLHGDATFHNMLSDGISITGMIDWANAKYGDFLYDAARLDFWYPRFHFMEQAIKRYQEKGHDTTFFKERIIAYELHVGLDALAFYVKSDQPEKYQRAKNRILELLSN